jgi:formylglycine-generating enzyme required for sulfatase activity
MRRVAYALPIVLATFAACGGPNVAQQVARPPAYNPAGETKCHVTASSTQPLIVEWPSPARGELEAIVEDHKNIAVVHYEGCSMRVLSGCTAPGKVNYVPYRNTKKDVVRITNADDLYANLPVGAASLEGQLQRSGELDVEMMLVGQYESDVDLALDLQGGDSCADATHVIRVVTVGAFDFHTGASANAGAGVNVLGAGVGASSAASQTSLASDGATDACSKATVSDTDPPPNCGALVRIEVMPLTRGKKGGAPTTVAAQDDKSMITIPSGSFMMGSNDGPDSEVPVHQASLASFKIDKTEVTVAAYDACVSAGGCSAAVTGDYCNEGKDDRANHPVNCVNWNQAKVYCEWAGKRLPTVSEWEYAARGAEARRFPWGDDPPADQLCWHSQSTCAVGSFPNGASPFGVLDMAGNVWEWTDGGWLNYETRQVNLDLKEYRGGGWADANASSQRCAYRVGREATFLNGGVGFRCAK